MKQFDCRPLAGQFIWEITVKLRLFLLQRTMLKHLHLGHQITRDTIKQHVYTLHSPAEIDRVNVYVAVAVSDYWTSWVTQTATLTK